MTHDEELNFVSKRLPKRPSTGSTLDQVRYGLNVVTDPGQSPSKETGDSEDGIHQLLKKLDSVLLEDPSIDSETRSFLQDQFGQALEDAASTPGQQVQMPDRGMWMDAVEALQSSGAVAENDANELIRRLDQALQSLQRRESQLAIEFSRRMQSDGEEQALAWFRQETSKGSTASETESSLTQPSSTVSPLLRSDVINSRSRRLRGPPRGV